jgi:PKD repeat protein
MLWLRIPIVFGLIGLAISSFAQPVASYVVSGDTNQNPVQVCRQYLTHFQGLNTGGIVAYNWSFATGIPPTSTNQSVNVLWNSNGVKNCSLTVTDTSGASNTINFNTIVSNTQPTVNFGSIPDLCSSDPGYTLTQGFPIGGVYFGPGVSNGQFFPGIADTGLHSLGYIYTSSNGCTDTAFSTVYVKPGPTAALMEINSFSNCNGFSFANQNFEIELYNQSSSPSGIIHYEIIWGDGSLNWDSASFRPGITHTYTIQGVYELRFIVTGSNNCTDTATYFVANTTNPASLNIFNPGGTNGCAPVTVTFPMSTTNIDTNTTYTVDWGDGTDTSFNHPPPAFITHTYDTTSCIEPTGFFNITATAINLCSSTSSTLQGPFVTQAAVADFSPEPGCAGVPHTLPNLSNPGFTGTCSRLTTYIWDFGDGTPPYSQMVNSILPPSVTHTWSSPGIYNVTLISVAPGGNCPADTITYPVCIEGVISNVLSISDTIGCQPVVPTISNTSDTTSLCSAVQYGWFVDTAYGWNITSGTINDYSLNIEFTEAGVYTLAYFSFNDCGGDTTYQKIYVRDRPEVLLPQNIQPYCDTLVINTATANQHMPLFDTNGSAITNYLWQITPPVNYLNGTDSTSQYPVFRLFPNTYTISLIVTNACGSDTAVQNVQVNTLTNGGFLTNLTAGCSPLQVDVQSTSSPGVQHIWFVDTSIYSTARDTTMIFTNNGVQDSTIRISLIAYSGANCADTLYQTITVNPGPVARFSATEECIGTSTVFYDSSSAALAPLVNWYWDFGNGDSSLLQNPLYTYPQPGRYWVNLSVTDSNGCTATFADTVWVQSNPTALFNVQYTGIPDSACVLDTVFLTDATIIDSNGTAAASWQWDIFDDGIVDDTVQNSYHLFNAPGSYPIRLTVTSSSGCVGSYVDTVHVSQPSNANFSLSTYGGCSPVSVVATNLSTGYNTNYNWICYSLDSNNNRVIEYTSNASDPNPIPPFQANVLSNKLVFVELTASNACFSSVYTDTVNVKPIPIPFFAFSVDTGCSPLTVTIQVDGLATGNPDSIQFDFGDGTPMVNLLPIINILPNGDTLFTYNQQSHTFVYNGIGLDTTYFVTLFASNECGDSSYTAPINVRNRSVQSFFTANQNTGCVPLNVNFNDLSFASFTVAYCFDFDTINKVCNGNLFFGQNPAYTFGSAGSYVVAQFAANDCGSDTSYQIIDVRPRPSIQFSFPNPVCTADTVLFTNNTSISIGNILGYEWHFGDGDSSNFTQPVHIYDSLGTYTVCLTVFTDSGCDSTFCQDIVVNAKPQADFSFQNDVCANFQPIQFLNYSTNSMGNIISYEWYFGDGNSSTQFNPQYTYQTPGTYDVKLVVTNDSGCKDSLTQQINIFPIPISDFTFSFASGDSCGVPAQIDFTNASNGAGTYYWDFDFGNNPGQDTSADVHPSFTYTDPGAYTVMLISTNGFGCQDTMLRTVQIHPIPNPDFIPSTTAGCAPLTVRFTNATGLPPGFTDSISYTWYFGDGKSSTQVSPENVFESPGTYGIKLVAQTQNDCRDSVLYADLITVYSIPQPQFSYSVESFGVYRYTPNTTGGTPPYTYSWSFGDGASSTDLNPVHEFDMDRSGFDQSFKVCLTATDANGCEATWCDTLNVGPFTLYVPTAMAPDGSGEEALFLPKGQGLKTYTCRIFDRWGNLLWETNKLDPLTAQPAEAWDGTYQGQTLPAGVYIWRIDATFSNGVVWRAEGINESINGNSGTITILR